MSNTPQAPSEATIAKIRNASVAPIEVRHSAAAEQWATSPERAVVFTVVKPNPAYLEPHERELVELGEAAPEYDVPAELRIDFTMPAKPNAGLSLLYLRRARENADLAMSWLLELALGADGYDQLAAELSGYQDETEAGILLNSVVARIQRVAMGGLEGKA